MYMAGAPASLSVCEIYSSILGESTYAGWPGVIVRLAGCPLRCAWCDTAYAQQRGEDVPLPEILRRVASFGLRLVLLTGGEPLAQPGSRYLVSELLRAGNQVVIETGGGVSIQGVDPRACVVLDIKCPGSGMQDRQVWENLEYLKPEDELKFVIGSRSDYEWAKDFLRQSGLAERQVVHFSPVTPPDSTDSKASDASPATPSEPSAESKQPRTRSSGQPQTERSGEKAGVPSRELAKWILEDRLPVRLNIQLHICIWGRGQRGV